MSHSVPARRPFAIALGAACALTAGAASASPFSITELASGYMVAAADAGGGPCANLDSGDAAARAACDKMKAEGKCGDGKCGAKKDAHADGAKAPAEAGKKVGEMKCGEGQCGGKTK